MEKIVVEAYNEQWPVFFEAFRQLYAKHLNGLILGVEHVGSTAVPGLNAKPIIDIDIVIEKEDVLPVVIEKLEQLGYVHAGDIGITGREAFIRTSEHVPECDPPVHWPAHHLYVCTSGVLSLRNHLQFRDYLRSHPEKAVEYSALKEQLAQTSGNIDEYVEGKTAFITAALQQTGMDTASLESIAEQNKNKHSG